MEQEINQPQPQVPVKSNSKITKSLIIGGILIILAGVGLGYFFSQRGKVGGIVNSINVAPGAVVTDKTAGLDDEKTFKDSATGVLKKGGLEAEGTHHLEREGGPSQNVYLTSSVIDLDDFIDQQVTVWGETNKAQKAGWLMDVGKVQIEE